MKFHKTISSGCLENGKENFREYFLPHTRPTPGPRVSAENVQENPAVARKPRDAAAVLFSLKFADDIHYKFKIVAKLRKPDFRAPNIPAQNRI